MPGSSKGPSRSSSSERERSESVEMRLANAEKEVAQVMGTEDYDELITIASEALTETSRSRNKGVLKSRKNLLWARSQAYHHKGLHSLALKDARAVMKIEPDDVAAYIRTANLLHDAGHVEQARDCLKRAAGIANSYDPSVRAIWLRRVEKQQRKISQASACPIGRLPNEMLVDIAGHLDADDHKAMSQTCRSWRKALVSAPHLWTTVTIKLKHKRLPERKIREFLHHLNACAERANNRIETFVLSGPLPTLLLETLTYVLRRSAQSLKKLSIGTAEHRLCYSLLYEYCPNLKSLVLAAGESCDVGVDYVFMQMLRDVHPIQQAEKPAPFMLDELVYADVGLSKLLPRHSSHARILKGYNPFRVYYIDDTERQTRHMQLLKSLAEHLEEWQDENCRERPYPHPDDRAMAFEFPQLVKLTNFQLSRHLSVSLPKVEELSLKPTRNLFSRDFESLVIDVLEAAPKLRKLVFLDGKIERDEEILWIADHHLLPYLRKLQDLEVLDLRRLQWDGDVSALLQPKVISVDGQDEIKIPLPKLRELRLNTLNQKINWIVEVLLTRDYLRTGENLNAAKRLATKKMIYLRKHPGRAPEDNPFQRGSKRSNHKELIELSKLDGPRLKNPQNHCALQTISFTQVTWVEEHAERAIRSIVPEVLIEYAPL